MGSVFVSELSRRFGVKPRVISGLFYDRVLDDEKCPVIAGRRCIPADYIPVVEQVLRDRGLIPAEAVT